VRVELGSAEEQPDKPKLKPIEIRLSCLKYFFSYSATLFYCEKKLKKPKINWLANLR
jgi:hypothetical protein